ncbi:MAG: SprB repeat-containing protein [Bacteroidetes bacterium]|nr:SprB repeat-containing protein [Bacteroidota bacterium]
MQGKPLQTNLKTIDAACIGIDNGRAWIESITGGLAPFTVTWSNGQNTDTIQNIQGKQWMKIQIIDALNCQRTDSIYIGIQSNIIIQSTTKNITCYGGGDGEIEVRASGGKSPYSYQWFNNTQDSIIKNLGANQPYALTVTENALGYAGYNVL